MMHKLQFDKIITVILVFLLTCSVAFSQELLLGLGENAQLFGTKMNPITRNSNYSGHLELPFIDDFAQKGHTPQSKLWQVGSGVFINNTFAINPPSQGVATFDPFDGSGQLYPQASSRVFAADTLCSNPLNLNYTASDSVYLSFYFQPQGYGDMPELGDSLILECYAPELNEWVWVWSAQVKQSDSSIIQKSALPAQALQLLQSGVFGETFFKAQLLINKDQFLKSGFQFRFINFASIAVHPAVSGRSTAADHWHLDYVYLDKNRSVRNTDFPDIGIVEAQRPTVSRYESVPAIHMNNSAAQQDLFPDPLNLSMVYRNMGWGTKSVIRVFTLKKNYGIGSTIEYTEAGSENIFDHEKIDFAYTVPRYTIQALTDSAAFTVQSHLVTDADLSDFRAALRHNDTTSYTQWFRDCYAYDDGTAENGYGLYGQGTAGGKVGIKFTNYQSDSLRGAYIYFNRVVGNANRDEFQLAVWEDDGSGKPGRLIHAEPGGRAEFKDQINQYVAYKFAKPVGIKSQTNYFIGWIQSTDNFLNVGFDRNRISANTAYYQISNNWESSLFAGSIMIRPIYCRTAAQFPKEYIQLGKAIVVPPTKTPELDYIPYPNPVSSLLYLKELDNTPLQATKAELFDLSGQLVKDFTAVNGMLDISSLTNGIYILRVWNQQLLRTTKRIQKN